MSAWRSKLLGFVRSDNDQASRQKAGMSERQLRFVRHLRRFRLLKTVQLVRRLKNKDAGTRSGAPGGIIRMFGVLLTGLFVMQAVVILADLMAAQCISRNTDVCLNVPARLSWVRSTINHFAGHPLTLALIIGILVGVLVSLATLLTVVPGTGPRPPKHANRAAGTPTDAREQAAAVTTISPKPGWENSFVDGDDPRVPHSARCTHWRRSRRRSCCCPPMTASRTTGGVDRVCDGDDLGDRRAVPRPRAGPVSRSTCGYSAGTVEDG